VVLVRRLDPLWTRIPNQARHDRRRPPALPARGTHAPADEVGSHRPLSRRPLPHPRPGTCLERPRIAPGPRSRTPSRSPLVGNSQLAPVGWPRLLIGTWSRGSESSRQNREDAASDESRGFDEAGRCGQEVHAFSVHARAPLCRTMMVVHADVGSSGVRGFSATWEDASGTVSVFGRQHA
jgi:hypothetical protein